MPLFEFQCECGHRFEALVRAQDEASCPGCQSRRLEKLMSTSAGRVGHSTMGLPVTSACPPSDAPPCGPGCCRL